VSGRPHRDADPTTPIDCAILTVSDTRTAATDESGALLRALLEAGGHRVRLQRVVKDEPEAIRAALRDVDADPAIRVVVINGGTGISRRDRTFETIADLVERPLPGFGEIFRALSFAEIGAAAMLTRATAGIRGRIALFVVPGSPAAVRLAAERLIIPQLSHLVGQIDRE